MTNNQKCRRNNKAGGYVEIVPQAPRGALSRLQGSLLTALQVAPYRHFETGLNRFN